MTPKRFERELQTLPAGLPGTDTRSQPRKRTRKLNEPVFFVSFEYFSLIHLQSLHHEARGAVFAEKMFWNHASLFVGDHPPEEANMLARACLSTHGQLKSILNFVSIVFFSPPDSCPFSISIPERERTRADKYPVHHERSARGRMRRMARRNRPGQGEDQKGNQRARQE